ncbi:MAG TPA: methyltransferase domain-containing protein [Gaiellaceae bacterium]|nr:methyltransferase domain-containing protein [Gaiellaceae bacterium]
MANEALKERQSAMWGKAPFVSIAETIADLHRAVADAMAARPGERVLDLGCGTGGVAELLAATGADVVGVDLAPGLIEIARERADAHGLEIDYRVGDCESLDLEDASFDAVGSSVGIMFAPTHEASASELARITRRGGRVVLANWTPGPGVQDLFKVMAPFQPAPPPSSPFDWGVESRVRELLGEAFDLSFETRTNVAPYPTGAAYWDDMVGNYGPTKVLHESLGERGEELRAAWVEFFGDGPLEHARPYVLVTGRRR